MSNLIMNMILLVLALLCPFRSGDDDFETLVDIDQGKGYSHFISDPCDIDWFEVKCVGTEEYSECTIYFLEKDSMTAYKEEGIIDWIDKMEVPGGDTLETRIRFDFQYYFLSVNYKYNNTIFYLKYECMFEDDSVLFYFSVGLIASLLTCVFYSIVLFGTWQVMGCWRDCCRQKRIIDEPRTESLAQSPGELRKLIDGQDDEDEPQREKEVEMRYVPIFGRTKIINSDE